MTAAGILPRWAEWADEHPLGAYTLGIEEEAMLLDPGSWALANRIDSVMPRLPADVVTHMTPETHGSALELRTDVHLNVGDAIKEIAWLRRNLAQTLRTIGLRGAVIGTHPFAVWQEIVVSAGERYQFVHGSMRELARREPTFALHVHIGIGDPETAIEVHNRMRVHLPLLLALSANSPFWQGRDTGLASARTPLFQAFPRVGIPRPFMDYAHYAHEVDMLIRTQAVPESTFLWWDVRPQPTLGTVEVRVMDAQTRAEDTGAIVALVQCLARYEGTERAASAKAIDAQEVISENRFLAARDGVHADLIDPDRERRVSVREVFDALHERLRPHAQELGCEAELQHCCELLVSSPADRQREMARTAPSLAQVVSQLSDDLT